MRHPPLPVLTILTSAFQTTAQLGGKIAQPLIIMGTLIVLIDLVSRHFFVSLSFLESTLILLPTAVAFSLFAITCHRIVLIGPDSVPILGVLSWTKREWRFLGWTILAYIYMMLVILLAGIPLAIFMTMSSFRDWSFEVFLWALFFVGFYVFARMSPLFPATAIGEKKQVDWAFQITEGNGFRMMIVVGLLPLVLGWCVEYLRGYNIFLDIAVAILGVVFLVVEIVALSLSYQYLVLEN